MRAGTLKALAELPGMPSEPSLRRFIAAHPAFPILDRGRKGRPFMLDLDAAAAFVAAHWRDGRHLAVRRANPAQSSLLDLLQGDPA